MHKKSLVNKTALLLVVAAISALFLTTISRFLESLFLAGLFAAVCHPLYRWFCHKFRDRHTIAAFATLVVVLLFILVPLILIFGAVANQAQQLTQNGLPDLQQLKQQPSAIGQLMRGLPFYDSLVPYRDFFYARLADLIAAISSGTIGLMKKATLGTVNAGLTLLIILYSFFFLLIDGDRLVYHILYYLPLDDEHEQRLLSRFRSVTMATLKGTAVIGFLQGALAGLALAVAGIPQALLWSVVMMFFSVVPGIGAAIIWIPAVIYLFIAGQYLAAAGLFLFCSLLVGSVDNVLRPKLVGGETQLHELMIFFSTLGGLLTFGFSGFIIGPIIAALFVTVWDIYGDEFSPWLPTTAFKTFGHPDSDQPSSASHAEPELHDARHRESQSATDPMALAATKPHFD